MAASFRSVRIDFIDQIAVYFRSVRKDFIDQKDGLFIDQTYFLFIYKY